MYENIRVPLLPLGASAPQSWVPQPSLNLVWPFLCWGGGGVKYVSVNRYGHVEAVSVHLTNDPGI